MSGNRLLVVDDQPAFGEVAAAVGTKSGYDVKVTSDAQEFRQTLSDWRPTVILLDLQMPERDGIELLRDLAEVSSAAAILITSGADDSILNAAQRLGVAYGLTIAGALQKPVRAALLRNTLDRLKQA